MEVSGEFPPAAHVAWSAVATYVHYADYVHKAHDNVRKWIGHWVAGVAAGVSLVAAIAVFH